MKYIITNVNNATCSMSLLKIKQKLKTIGVLYETIDIQKIASMFSSLMVDDVSAFLCEDRFDYVKDTLCVYNDIMYNGNLELIFLEGLNPATADRVVRNDDVLTLSINKKYDNSLPLGCRRPKIVGDIELTVNVFDPNESERDTDELAETLVHFCREV